jgi:two-component system, response regulator PdtaR
MDKVETSSASPGVPPFGGQSDMWARLSPQAGRVTALPPGLKVLVVDDELWALLDMEWVVRKLGLDVVGSAATAIEAIRIAEQLRPDLVLMDVRLGDDSDGVVAATIIRERFAIPSLFVTAHGDLATRMRAEAAHPAGFIEKPFAPDSLARAITEALSPKHG